LEKFSFRRTINDQSNITSFFPVFITSKGRWNRFIRTLFRRGWTQQSKNYGSLYAVAEYAYCYLSPNFSPPFQLQRFIVRSFHTILKQRVSVEVCNF